MAFVAIHFITGNKILQTKKVQVFAYILKTCDCIVKSFKLNKCTQLQTHLSCKFRLLVKGGQNIVPLSDCSG